MSSSRILAGAAAGLFVLTLGIAQAVAQVDKALDDASVQKRVADLGGSIPSKRERNPSVFDAYVKAEVTRWAPILKAASQPVQ